MDSPSVIILHVGSKNPAEMSLVQDDDMIERASADAADDPLTIWILPWTLGGKLYLFNIHMLNPLLEQVAVDAVPISQEVPRGALSHGKASTICWAVHWAVGCSVMLKCTIQRRS